MFVILVIVYRSPLLPVLVLLTSVFALCVALLTVWWLAYAGIVVLNGQVQGILFILVIGAATDYALLYVARFREAIAAGARRWDATTTAWRGAFEPIIASGGTVIAGLLCLLLSDLATNRALGPDRLDRHRVLGAVGADLPPGAARARSAARRSGRSSRRRPLADDPRRPDRSPSRASGRDRRASSPATRARCGSSAPSCCSSAPSGMLQLKADGVPSSDLVLGASEARDGQEVLAEHFPAGSGSPVYVDRARGGPRRSGRGRWTTATGIESVAAASEDSPTGQATVEVEDGEAVLTAVGPPGAPAPEPTVSEGDVLLVGTLTDAADSVAAEDTVRELRVDLDEALGAGRGARRRRDRDRHRLERHVDPRPHGHHPGDPRSSSCVILMLLLRSILAPVLLILTRDPVVRDGARRERARVQQRVRLPRRRPRRAALRVRLPGGARASTTTSS